MKQFDEYHLGSSSRIVTPEVPGKNSQRLLELQRSMEANIVTYPKKMPMAVSRAKGAIVEDVDGNRFIDFFAGCGVNNVGHCNQDVLDFVRKQQDELIHFMDFPTVNKMDLITEILGQLPEAYRDQYKVAFCGPTGSDSIEAAIKLSKYHTGRSGIIAFQGSYHGMTSGALGVTSDVSYRERIESLIPNVHFIPYSYCYRCVFGKNPNECRLDCAEYLDNILTNPHSGVKKPAAILLEPIQGEGGSIVPKKGFLKRVIEIASRHQVLTIFDEVQSGFFRSGNFLASLELDVLPDIFTLSKGLGGVGFPIAALIYKKSIESWKTGSHIGTFRGNQVSMAAANGAFDFVKRNNLGEHVSEIGNYLLTQLKDIAVESKFIGDVRGKGLFIGVEFVKNKVTKAPYPEAVKQMQKECFNRGLLFEVGGHYNNVIRIIPPLIINQEIVDNAIAIFRESLSVVESDVNRLNEIHHEDQYPIR